MALALRHDRPDHHAPVTFLWAMFADRSRGSPPPPTRRPDARAALERHADAPDPDARAASIRLIRKRSRAC